VDTVNRRTESTHECVVRLALAVPDRHQRLVDRRSELLFAQIGLESDRIAAGCSLNSDFLPSSE
jgi:hypothetical protein